MGDEEGFDTMVASLGHSACEKVNPGDKVHAKLNTPMF
jgi:hypothetical protein